MRKERSMVRKLLFVFGAILLCVIIAALVAISLGPSRPPMPEVRLADKRIVRLAAVTVGKNHSMHSSSRLRNILFHISPDGFKRQLGPNFNSSFGFQHPGIALWLMCYDPALKQYVPNAIDKLVIVDDHGCELENRNSGVTSDGWHSATVMHVANFPRDREKLTFRMLNFGLGTNVLGEITIQNPARRQRENWKPLELQITVTNGSMTAKLNRIAPMMRGNVDVELFENGGATKDWSLDDLFYIDPLGNFGRSRFDPMSVRGHDLCRKEVAWKLRMRWMRSPRAEFPPADLWKVGKVTLPLPGKFSTLALSNTVGGIPVTIQSFCGAGSFDFSNGVCFAGTPWTNGMSSLFSVTSVGKAGSTTTRASPNVTLSIEHADLHRTGS